MTSHWDVLCFDHNLRLMWTAKVKVMSFPHLYDIKYIAALGPHCYLRSCPALPPEVRMLANLRKDIRQGLLSMRKRQSSHGRSYMQEDVLRHRHASAREVAVHISNHSMQVGDRGVVVVGASADLGDLGHLGSAGDLLYSHNGFKALSLVQQRHWSQVWEMAGLVPGEHSHA